MWLLKNLKKASRKKKKNNNNKQKKKKGDFNTLRFTQTNKALAPLLLIVGG